MDLIFDSEVFCRETECVPAHRIENVIAFHSLFTGYHVKRGIRSWVAYVKALPRRVGKLYKCIEFRLTLIKRYLEGLVFVPIVLPFLFDCFVIISHLSYPPRELQNL